MSALLEAHLYRAAAARHGYMGHKLRVTASECGKWIATTDQYDGPADPGTRGGIDNLCVWGDTEAEALDEIMNAIDLEIDADRKAGDEWEDWRACECGEVDIEESR
jgi:hypothetical protein